jgi:hypothetical protein
VADFVWNMVRIVVEWPPNPHYVIDLLSLGKMQKEGRFSLFWIGVAVVMWSLWTIHNKLIL